jgi:hypothetical protein
MGCSDSLFSLYNFIVIFLAVMYLNSNVISLSDEIKELKKELSISERKEISKIIFK